MRKVIFTDRTYVVIEDRQEAALEVKLSGTAKFRLTHLAGVDLIDPREVRRVTNAVAGQDYSPKVDLVDEKHRLASRHELTDEEREANIKKFAEIKEKFLAKQAKKAEDKRKATEAERKKEEKRKAILKKQGEDLSRKHKT